MSLDSYTATGFSRRELIRRASAFALAAWCAPLLADPASRRFQIGACDWSLDKICDPSALELARRIGLDGVMVSLGPVGDPMRLRRPQIQRQYKEAENNTGLKVSSLALIALNEIPYKSDPRTIEWVRETIGICQALGVRVVLLPFFSQGDLRGDKPGVTEVVRRLKIAAPKAERAGVVLGLESWLSAAQLIDIMDQVGSPAVQVYYDLCNTSDMGYDIYQEIRTLGRRRICEFHAKENGKLLGQGKIDFAKVRAALDDIGYRGWVQIEGALPPGAPLLESYRANCRFLRRMLS